MPFHALVREEQNLRREKDSALFVAEWGKDGQWDREHLLQFKPVRYWNNDNDLVFGAANRYFQRTYAHYIQIEFTGYLRVVEVFLEECMTGRSVRRTFRVPDGMLPGDWVSLRRFTRIKRHMLALLANRPDNNLLNCGLRHRFVEKSSWVHNIRGVRDRHTKLCDKLRSLSENADGDERRAGWLRVYRHVRRDPSLIGYCKSVLDALDGKVSYARYAHNPVKRRVVSRMSKIISAAGVDNALTGLLYQDWLSMHKNNWKIEVIEGPQVVQAYLDAIGCDSCMTGDEELVDLYQRTPDKIKMLVLHEDGHPTGRALMWMLDEDSVPDGVPPVYIDRPYPQSDRVFAYYKRYAEREGIKLSYMDGGMHACSRDITCTVNQAETGAIPYMDTWESMSVLKNGKWRFFMSSDGDYGVCCTEGGPLYSGSSHVYCHYCGERILSEDAHDDGYEYWCDSCWHNTHSECECCGETVHNEDLREVNGNEQWCDCCARDTWVCYGCDERVSDNRAIEIDGEWYCDNCAENVKKEGDNQ